MLVGSFSTIFYGTERSTRDADIVLQLGERSITPLFKVLGSDFRCDPQMTLETATLTSRYVLQHTASEFKIELFLLSEDAHDLERFRRRRLVSYLGESIWLPTAEDAIITEQDVVAVVAVQFGQLDLAYIRSWCDKHSSRADFERILAAVTEKPSQK